MWCSLAAAAAVDDHQWQFDSGNHGGGSVGNFCGGFRLVVVEAIAFKRINIYVFPLRGR